MSTPTERRRFFRINDTLGIALRLLDDVDAGVPLVSEGIRPLSVLTSHDNKIKNLLSELKISQPQLGELLDAINSKLDGVIAQLDIDHQLIQDLAYRVQEVNISACGVALLQDQYWDKDAVLAVELLLESSNLHIATHAQVVDCIKAEAGEGFFLRLNFIDMDIHDQEVLVQHIARRQVHLIRNLREQEPFPR